jgi:hypothetical protein
MWSTLTQEEKQEYFDIPHFNWEGFEYICGISKQDYYDDSLDNDTKNAIKLLQDNGYKIIKR